jgi:hypothetical protein
VVLIPCLRITSPTGNPASASFKIPTISLSVNRDFFMQNLLSFNTAKQQKTPHQHCLNLGGDYTVFASSLDDDFSPTCV